MCLGPCPVGGVCRFRGWRWLRDRGVLLRTVVDYAPVFPFPVIEINCAMTAAASEFPPSLQRVTGTQGPGREQHISHPGIPVLQHPDPLALDIHMTPPDDPWPLSRETSQPTASPFPSIRMFSVLHMWGPNCSQRSSSKEGSQTRTSDAPPMLWPHSRRTRKSPWIARRFGCPKGLPGA